jgi:pimeloyl-ACP methyl ester carboxylesterase
MHVTRCGSGDSILFIHGMPTSGRLWTGIIERLCEHYTCFAVDLPGLGNSPHEGYDPDFLRHFAEQIDQIRIANKIEKWHVVGHDAGSVVAVHYARYFPEHVACMALLSPSLFPELKPFYLLEALRKPILGELLAPLIGLIFWKIAMHRAISGVEYGDQAIGDFCKPFCWLLRLMGIHARAAMGQAGGGARRCARLPAQPPDADTDLSWRSGYCDSGGICASRLRTHCQRQPGQAGIRAFHPSPSAGIGRGRPGRIL